MLEQYVYPGQCVEIETVTRSIAEGKIQQEKKIYRSKVVDILSAELLEIQMPYKEQKAVLLPADSEYMMYFYVENGIYQCKARIVDRYKTNNIFILAAEIMTPFQKIQRREYYRYNCAMELETRELTEEEKDHQSCNDVAFRQDLPLDKNMIVDISGGGLRFVSMQRYATGTLLYCKYSLPDKGARVTYEMAGKVLHEMPLEKRPGYFEHRVQYIKMDNEKREEIIRYIFEQERMKRKNKKE